MKYFVYELVDPRDGRPFYIGKGCRRRPNQHLNETADTTTNPFKYRKIQSIRKHGYEPTINIVKRFDDEAAAYAYEAYLINKTSGLTNIQPGGAGGVGNLSWKEHNPSSKVKGKTYEERYGPDKATWMREIRSKKLTGRQYSEETISKMSEAALKRDHSFKQKQIHTPDGVFSSMTEAAKHFGRAPSVITTRVNSDKHPEYYLI